MSVRAKFKVTKIEITSTDETKQEIGTVHLSPVTSGSKENESFYKWTPSGGMTLGTINPDALKQFKVGQEYYIDFTPIETAAAEKAAA